MAHVFLSKRNLLAIYETTFKKPKLVARKSCTVSYWKFEDCWLIKWRINGEMVDNFFCIGVLLIRCMPSIFSWQWLQREQLLIHWLWVDGGMVDGIMLEINLSAIWRDTRNGRMCKTNIRICTEWRGSII